MQKTLTFPFSLMKNRDRTKPREKRTRMQMFWENAQILLKTTGMITWFILFVLLLLEIKRYFNIDLIPGYDSAFEEVYGAVRKGVTKGSESLK